MLRAHWVTLRARWVARRARWVTLRARWVTLRARWVTLTAHWVTLRARGVTLTDRWVSQVYMLYELEPSKELTGGAWYTEQEFDAEFIEVLRDHCLKYVLHKARYLPHHPRAQPLVSWGNRLNMRVCVCPCVGDMLPAPCGGRRLTVSVGVREVGLCARASGER
jgi:hypothetical protein